MREHAWLAQVVLLLLFSCCFVYGYSSFKSKIPNGHRVPNPCDAGDIWEGVGHKNRDGKGPRNPFGEDWSLMSSWPSICQLDSDTDGRTNGEELGDPDCTWTEQNGGDILTDNISHPGICEPLDSENCTEINKWLNCAPTEFSCNSTKQPDVFNMTLQLQNETIPAKDTTYVCMVYDIPTDRTYDVIAARPILGNKNVIHHMILYGCKDKHLKVEPGSLVPECFMTTQTGCTSMIAAFGLWDPALDAFCLPPDVGARIGQGGYQKLMIQFHWTNNEELSGLTDSSGLEIFYTSTLRQYNSGMLLFGQMHIYLPPKLKSISVSGGCQPFCSRHRIRGQIKVIESLHHMHYYGVAQKIEIFRNETKVCTISDEKNFDYNIPTIYRFYDNPVQIHPGDYIKTTCTYNSMKADKPIRFGVRTRDEMCFGFIRYYPLENLPLDEGGCSEYGIVPLCKIHTREHYTVDGCDVKSVLTFHGVNTNNPLLADITRHCNTQDKCTRECLKVQRNIAEDPCFQNDIGMYVKYLLVYWRRWEGMKILKDLMTTNCSQDLLVEGKVALVTGSTCGIGLGIAHHLAEKGCDVIVTGFGTEEEIDAILSEFRRSYKGKFTYVEGDLSKQDSTLQMCKQITDHYPDGVDIIINNAGIQHVCPIEDYPLSKFNEMVAINLAAPFVITQYFIPYFKKKGWGRIVNTASQMGMISQPGKTPYSCTKAGLLGFTRGTALELAPYGITCNAICPAYVETQLLAKQIEVMAKKDSVTYDEARDKFFKEKHPTGKPVTIEQHSRSLFSPMWASSPLTPATPMSYSEIAYLVGFLCSTESASITGASMSIDAGHPIM